MGRAKKRRRRTNLAAPEPIDELLERAGENRFAKRRAPIPSHEWRAAVGPRIADRAVPFTLERGVLVVKVATSVWANELQLLAPTLLGRLKERGIAVTSLRFRVGPLDVVDRPPERRSARAVPSKATLDPTLRHVLGGVTDNELRRVIERAASANLAWQSFVDPRKDAASAGARPASAARDPRRQEPTARNVSEAPRGARDPRAAGRESAPPGRTSGDPDEAPRGTRGAGSGRRS